MRARMDNRILAIDLLGHGESSKLTSKISTEKHMELIYEIIMKRKFHSPTLIGHSIGGVISILYAANYPENIPKLNPDEMCFTKAVHIITYISISFSQSRIGKFIILNVIYTGFRKGMNSILPV